MNKLNISAMMDRATELNRSGEEFTLLGIGPMSRECIYATLSIACERDFPVMFIASRNQVDSDEFGHGYVCAWDQKRFVSDTGEIAREIGFDGLMYFCRDHGGPWQRDEEYRGRLDIDTAMAIAKRSYLSDMENGFDLLHIDPTKDPHVSGVLALDVVLDRTVELISSLESERMKRGLPPVAYEVGTEETNGGLTSEQAFTDFIRKLLSELGRRNLPKPEFIVGQTGTLVRLTENVGHFNSQTARKLSCAAQKLSVGIKEHNADYLSDSILLGHRSWGVTAANVAPEFGVVETRAYLELALLEKMEFGAGKCSNLAGAVMREAIQSERWRKWMVGENRTATIGQVSEDPELSALIANICGHYTFETEAFQKEYATLKDNLAGMGIDARQYVIKKIMNSIDRYAHCFGLYGLTSKLLQAEGGIAT